MANTYAVAAINLDERERLLVRAVLAVSEKRDPAFKPYVKAEGVFPQVVLVNADLPAALQAWERYRTQLDGNKVGAIMLTVDGNAKSRFDYVMQRPFAGRQLLALLEKVASEVHGSSSAAFEMMRTQSLMKKMRTADHTAAAAPAPAPSAPASAPPALKTSQKGFTALVVDDSLPVRIQMKSALDGLASKVDFAETGEDAFELLGKSNYDIVFLDVVLPGAVNGYQICKAIKSKPEGRHTPVVMLTSNSSPADRIKGKMAGCDTYLVKPVNPVVFSQVVGSLVGAKA